MADLPYIKEAQEVKITGQDSSGNTVNFVNADSNGNLNTIDYATSATGSSVPVDASFIAGKNGSGNLTGVSVDSSGRVNTDLYDGSGNAITSTSTGAKRALDINLTGPNSGFQAQISAIGALSVAGPGITLFNDGFDVSGLDTTNRWNTPVSSNGGAQSQSLGALSLTTTTAASSQIAVSTQPTFTPGGSFYAYGSYAQFENPVQTNTHRFFGLGTPNGSYTAITPLLNAVGFELDISNNFSAVVYSSGSKIFSQNLNTYLASLTGQKALLVLLFRADTFLFYVNDTNTPVANYASKASLDSFIIPVRVHTVNNTTPPSGATTTQVSSLAIVDTANSVISIGDGAYPFRKTTVTSGGALVITPTDGYKATYAAAITALTTAATPTDIFTISGSSTKTIRINKISITGTQTTAAIRDVLLIKRSTVNSGGTSTVLTSVPYDSNDSAATATVLAYTVNPTLGTTVGTIFSSKLDIAATNLVGSSDRLEIIFGNRASKAIVLRGTAQSLSINLNSVTSSGNLWDINVEFTEE